MGHFWGPTLLRSSKHGCSLANKPCHKLHRYDVCAILFETFDGHAMPAQLYNQDANITVKEFVSSTVNDVGCYVDHEPVISVYCIK